MSNQITPNPSVPSQVVAEVKFPRWINNLGIIPTSYKDSMSYYECLAWLCKFLEETVIPSVNENGEAVEELQNLYIELNSYVTHYFETLDVQEEINNKLDEMVEDGTLPEIVADYLQTKAVFGFDTVADMKEGSNLINGSFARTLGYSTINDLAGGLYKIRTITNEDVIDEKNIIAITSSINLIAELIKENELICFNSVSELKSSNKLVSGMFAKTLGFHSKNDGGSALYKIRNITNNDVINEMDIIAINNTENQLIAELISDKTNPLCYGATLTDENSNNHTIINYMFTKVTTVNINQNITLKSGITLNTQFLELNFKNITYTGTGYCITIDQFNNNINGNKILTTNGSAIKIGDENLTGQFKINLNEIYSEHNGVVLGGTLGVLNGQLNINTIYYKEHGIDFDLTDSYVGQIGIYNTRFDDISELTENYAVYINTNNNNMTGLDMYNISFEGTNGGIYAKTSDTTHILEHLNVYGCRCAEMSLLNNKKILKFETSTTLSNLIIHGEFHFDMALPSSFDFSGFYSLQTGTFRLYGDFCPSSNGRFLLATKGYLGNKSLILVDTPNQYYSLKTGTNPITRFGEYNVITEETGSDVTIKPSTTDYFINGTFYFCNGSANSINFKVCNASDVSKYNNTLPSGSTAIVTIVNTNFGSSAQVIVTYLTGSTRFDV